MKPMPADSPTNDELPGRDQTLDYRSAQDGDVLAWSNWRGPLDVSLHVFTALWLLLWIPSTIFITFSALSSKSRIEGAFAVWFWLGLIAGCSIYWRLLAHETIRVRDDLLELTTKLLFYQRTRVVRREHLISVSLEFHNDESMQTLNLFLSNAVLRNRIMIAHSLSRKRKLSVFVWLKQCMKQRAWECEFCCDNRQEQAS